jgi:hypothetical protein
LGKSLILGTFFKRLHCNETVFFSLAIFVSMALNSLFTLIDNYLSSVFDLSSTFFFDAFFLKGLAMPSSWLLALLSSG